MNTESIRPGLVAVLLIPAIFLALYSSSDKDFRYDDVVLEKADIVGYFNLPLAAAIDTIVIIEEEPVDPNAVVYDTLPKRILFFGDSMLEGLHRRLKQYAAENNHELLSVIWVSSSTKFWAESIDTLTHFMRKFEPDYIMLCLGANELFVRDLNRRDSYIKTLIQAFDTIPYIWIGPPNWKEDSGINDLIEENVGADRFFLSKRLTYRRANDGIHPTYASAAMWMDSVANWMRDSIQYRIAMELPQSTDGTGKTIRLKPPE